MAREAYERLGGGYYHFDPSEAQMWPGITHSASRRSFGWGENLFRTSDGRWIIGFHDDRVYRPRGSHRQGAAFREVDLDSAGQWFISNRVELSTSLIEDMDRAAAGAAQRRSKEARVSGVAPRDSDSGGDSPALRVFYVDLDGGRSAFDPNHPDFFWQGKWVIDDSLRFRIDLFRWHGRWIVGH